MKQSLSQKLRQRRGQSAVEYILILALVVGVIFVFGGKFRQKIQGTTDTLFNNVDSGVNSLSSGK